MVNRLLYIALFVFLLCTGGLTHAQNRPATRDTVVNLQVPVDTIVLKQEVKKQSFKDALLSMGKGVLNRLKYRFNLAAVEEKIDKTQRQLKGKENTEN